MDICGCGWAQLGIGILSGGSDLAWPFPRSPRIFWLGTRLWGIEQGQPGLSPLTGGGGGGGCCAGGAARQAGGGLGSPSDQEPCWEPDLVLCAPTCPRLGWAGVVEDTATGHDASAPAGTSPSPAPVIPPPPAQAGAFLPASLGRAVAEPSPERLRANSPWAWHWELPRGGCAQGAHSSSTTCMQMPAVTQVRPPRWLLRSPAGQ